MDPKTKKFENHSFKVTFVKINKQTINKVSICLDSAKIQLFNDINVYHEIIYYSKNGF